MNRVVEFLKKCGTFYLATVEGDQPRVRPFGAVLEMKGKVYICTNNKKDCFRQIKKNPKVEICGMLPSGDSWIRVSGTLVVDDKWMACLSAAVQTELDRVSQTLTGRIRQLAERYATPLPLLKKDLETLSARVDEHLKKMGAAWK
jgi:hypothetical protein